MSNSPHRIVLGNEKGGTGKSTVSMHLVVNLLKRGAKVGTIDVDARQGTMTRYVENRKAAALRYPGTIELSEHIPIFRSELANKVDAEAEETQRVTQALANLAHCDYIVIDTPGSDTFLSRLVHSYADTLITPLNDSFVDLDMLVRIDGDSLNILKPSVYAEMVWDQKKTRAIRDGRSIDWIVMRNRLSSINARNKEEMERVLQALAKRIGFRLADGFSERVIFRELFLQGLTVLDLEAIRANVSMSHIAARQELRDLFEVLRLPRLGQVVEEERLSA